MRKHIILLADDDREDIDMLLDVFEDIEVSRDSVAIAANGLDALDMLNQYPDDELPCLVVLDLNMPKMGGSETLRHIKASDRFNNVKVVIYSTSENPHEKELCTRLGALEYVTKPVLYKESLKVANYFKQICEESSVQSS